MSILTEEIYYKLREKYAEHAKACDNYLLTNEEVDQHKAAIEYLDTIFKAHWDAVNAFIYKENDPVRLRVAQSLTRWMNGRRQDPLPDWNSLPLTVRKAYLEQADDAIAAMKS